MLSSAEKLVLLEDQIQLIRAQKYASIVWSPKEQLFRTHFESNNRISNQLISFSAALEIKLKMSVFGTYLEAFNRRQIQDKDFNDNKLGVTNWNIKEYNQLDLEKFHDNNDLFDECFSMLKLAVKEVEVIDWEFLYQRVINLRLNSCHVIIII